MHIILLNSKIIIFNFQLIQKLIISLSEHQRTESTLEFSKNLVELETIEEEMIKG